MIKSVVITVVYSGLKKGVSTLFYY